MRAEELEFQQSSSTEHSLVPTTSSPYQRQIEMLLLNLVGNIPRPLGVILRRLLYPYIFAHVGKNVYIQSGCEFLGADSIELGDDVRLLRDIRVNFKSVNSRLRLGNQVALDRGVDITVSGDDCLMEIGDHSYLGAYVCLIGPGHIKIGKHTLIAAHSGIFANNHRTYGLSREGIEIGDYCWIGSGVKVLDGVKIGNGCVIGAGAVVTKDIPPNSVAVGVPAQVIKPNVESPFYAAAEVEAEFKNLNRKGK